MERKLLKYTSLVLFFCVMFTGCDNSPKDIKEYIKTVETERAKGDRTDSLFLGLKFGMTSKEFFAHCWELNKKGVLTDGSNNTAVLYKINKGLRYPASMNFYPEFDRNKIYKMKATFQYNAWAPWNKSLFSDSLVTDILQLYRSWYGGNDFITMKEPVRGTIYVKVDGNRRITLGRYDDMIVKVDYTDLLIEPETKR